MSLFPTVTGTAPADAGSVEACDEYLEGVAELNLKDGSFMQAVCNELVRQKIVSPAALPKNGKLDIAVETKLHVAVSSARRRWNESDRQVYN